MTRHTAVVLPTRAFFLAILSLVSLPWAVADAQAPEAGIPARGRVRVHAPAVSQSAVTGRYDGLEADSLSLVLPPMGSRMRIPLSEVTRLEVSDGRNSGRAAAVGALIGFGAGLAGGILCLALCPSEPGSGANLAPAGGLVLGIVVGIPVGAVVGGTVFAPERWRPMPIPAAGR